jgi:short-subunit dehydrogenase
MPTYPFRRALVTGASSGIGREIAEQLGAAKVELVVVARREDRLRDLAARFPGTEVIVADLTTPEGVKNVVDRIGDPTRPEIDLVVNNAGFGTSGHMHRLDPDRLSREIRLNVEALTRIMHAAIVSMVPRGIGYVLNVSSVASFQASPGLAVYSATKAYVTSLTEGVSEELRHSGVRVTALCPGLTKTEFQSISNTSGLATQFPDFVWTAVPMVARAGLRAVAKGQTIVVPGALYKVLVGFSTMIPRGLSRKITRIITRRG